KLGQTAAQLSFVCLGLAVVLPRFTHLSPWVGGLAGIGVAVLAGSALVWLVSRGFWAALGGVARRLALARFLPGAWSDPGRQMDLALGRLGGARVVAVLGCFLGGWAVGALEIYVILAWLGGPVDCRRALALEIGSVFIDGTLFFIPAKVGTQEGGKVLLFAMLGLDPARGLTVGVVRRIRELTYAGLGLAVLGWLTTRTVAGGAGAPARAPPLPSGVTPCLGAPSLERWFSTPPPFEGFEGGAGSRYQARREIRSFWYPTWLAQPAAMVPGSRLIDAPPDGLTVDQVVPLAKEYDLAVLHTSTPSFANDARVATR